MTRIDILSTRLACIAIASLAGAPALALQDAARRLEPGQMGHFRKAVTGLPEATAATIASNDSIFALLALSGEVVEFDGDGGEKRRFGSSGSGAGQLLDPSDIDLAGEHILVADTGNHRIQWFAADGSFVREVGSFGHGESTFNQPTGIGVGALDGALRIAVADTRNDRVQVFDESGAFVLEFGGHGHEDGKFNRPVDVAIDETGAFFVLDFDNHRVQKFDAQGEFVLTWGDFGPYPGMFASPSGIEYDDGLLFVADRDNSRVQVFDTEGEPVYKWGVHALRPREGGGKLHYPNHVAIAPSGEFAVVCERFEDRLQIFVPTPEGASDDAWVPQLDLGVIAHYGGRIDAKGFLMVATEPAGPELQVNQMFRDEPIQVCNYEVHGRGAGQMLRPVDAALDVGRRRIYVSDPGNMRLAIYGWEEREWMPLRQDPALVRLVVELDMHDLRARQGDDGPQWPIEPGALEVDAEGRLYMADPRNRCIWVLDPDLKIERAIGGPDDLQRPIDIALDTERDEILVADELAKRVAVFGSDGAFKSALTRTGRGDEVFLKPAGVGFDDSGTLYVTDGGRHLVCRYDTERKPLEPWGRNDGQPSLGAREFYKPRGVTFNGDGHVVVLDFGNHRGQIFEPDGTFVRAFGPKLFIRPAMASLPKTKPWEGARISDSNAGTYKVHWKTRPDPIPLNDSFSVDVWVFASNDDALPLYDIDVEVDAGMPSHGHGMNRKPKVESKGQGHFVVHGMLFHMPGDWELYFDITRAAVTERAQFPIVLD